MTLLPEKNIEILDDDAKRRLNKNPMRILDSKNPHMQNMLEKAPKLIDTINEDAKNHFNSLCQILKQSIDKTPLYPSLKDRRKK